MNMLPRAMPFFAAFLAGVIFWFGPACAIAAENVTVRAGLHADYGRLVFDWPSPVKHKAEIANGVLKISFDRPLMAEFEKARRTLKKYIRLIEATDNGRVVTVTLQPGTYKARNFSSGRRAVVDISLSEQAGNSEPKENSSKTSGTRAARPATKAPIQLGPKRRMANGEIPVRTLQKQNYGRVVFDWPRKIGFSVDRNGQTATIKFSAKGAIDTTRLKSALPTQIRTVTQRRESGQLAVSFTISPAAQLRYFHDKSSVVFDVVEKRKARPRPAMAAANSVENGNAADRGKAEAGKLATLDRPVTKPLPPPFISIDAAYRGGSASFRFNWRRPVSAAIHRQGDLLVVSFDQRARLDIGAVRSVAKGIFRDSKVVLSEYGTTISIPVGGHARTGVRRDGTIWVVESGAAVQRKFKSLPLRVRKERDGGRSLLIATKRAGGIIPITGDATGIGIYAATMSKAGQGISPERRFAEFSLMPSDSGLAIRPFDERVRVKRTPDGFVVFRPGGLNISPDNKMLSRRDDKGSGNRLLDLARWRDGPEEDYRQNEFALRTAVIKPGSEGRNDARLRLARFYLAHNLAPESLGVIAALLRENPARLREPAIRALRGAARYMMGHLSEARRDLSHKSLAGVREIYPWRAAIAAAAGDWGTASELFGRSGSEIGAYPPEYSARFGLLAAEAALSVKDHAVAEKRLAAVGFLQKSRRQENQLSFLKGHLLKQQGKPDKALELWSALAKQGDRPGRARAAYAATTTLLENGKIKPADAIDRLERLKFAWRNSVFEFDLLQTLGRLYAGNNDLRQALVTLRQAATLYRNIKGAAALTTEMRAMFREFYLGDDIGQLKPVVALGLFNEFRELTPEGKEGDKMINRLAERLVEVDLLRDAAKVLTHQVRFRLEGVDKAQTGARIAEIYLLDGKPNKAAAILQETEVHSLPVKLTGHRRLLQATALVKAGEFGRAAHAIERDFSREADLLRAELQWRAGRWQKASRILARLTGPFDSKALSADEAGLLLRRAVALGLSGDEQGMEFLRERFGAAMEKSSHAAAFKAVAGGKLRTAPSFAALARQAAELETFNAFMKTLGKRPVRKDQPAAKPDQTAALN